MLMSMTIQKLICSHFGFKIFSFFFPLENATILILDKTRKIYLMFLHLFQLLAINEPKFCDSCVYILDFQRNTRRQHALFAMDDTKQHECCELIFLKNFPHSSFLSLTFRHTRMQNTSIPAKDKGKVYMCKATMKSTANYIQL